MVDIPQLKSGYEYSDTAKQQYAYYSRQLELYNSGQMYLGPNALSQYLGYVSSAVESGSPIVTAAPSVSQPLVSTVAQPVYVAPTSTTTTTRSPSVLPTIIKDGAPERTESQVGLSPVDAPRAPVIAPVSLYADNPEEALRQGKISKEQFVNLKVDVARQQFAYMQESNPSKYAYKIDRAQNAASEDARKITKDVDYTKKSKEAAGFEQTRELERISKLIPVYQLSDPSRQEVSAKLASESQSVPMANGIKFSQANSLTGGGTKTTTGTSTGLQIPEQTATILTPTSGQLKGAQVLITPGKRSASAGELLPKLTGADFSGYQAPRAMVFKESDPAVAGGQASTPYDTLIFNRAIKGATKTQQQGVREEIFAASGQGNYVDNSGNIFKAQTLTPNNDKPRTTGSDSGISGNVQPTGSGDPLATQKGEQSQSIGVGEYAKRTAISFGKTVSDTVQSVGVGFVKIGTEGLRTSGLVTGARLVQTEPAQQLRTGIAQGLEAQNLKAKGPAILDRDVQSASVVAGAAAVYPLLPTGAAIAADVAFTVPSAYRFAKDRSPENLGVALVDIAPFAADAAVRGRAALKSRELTTQFEGKTIGADISPQTVVDLTDGKNVNVYVSGQEIVGVKKQATISNIGGVRPEPQTPGLLVANEARSVSTVGRDVPFGGSGTGTKITEVRGETITRPVQDVDVRELPDAYFVNVKGSTKTDFAIAGGSPTNLPGTQVGVKGKPVPFGFTFEATPGQVDKLIPGVAQYEKTTNIAFTTDVKGRSIKPDDPLLGITEPSRLGEFVDTDKMSVREDAGNFFNDLVGNPTTRGAYSPTSDSIRVSRFTKGDELTATKIHEYVHKADPKIRADEPGSFEGLLAIDEDFYSLAQRTGKVDQYKRSAFETDTLYTDDLKESEFLARFAETFPEEIINPTTKTGEYLRGIYSEQLRADVLSKGTKTVIGTTTETRTGGLAQRRVEPSDLPAGINEFTASTAEYSFEGFKRQSQKGTIDPKQTFTVNDPRLGFEIKKLDTVFERPGQIENLRPYDEARGDFFFSIMDDGVYTLGRQTENRRFPLGSKEIPGRRVEDTVRLPDDVATQKNLPRELLAYEADREEARYLAELQSLNLKRTGTKGPIKVTDVTVTPKQTPARTFTTSAGAANVITNFDGTVLLQDIEQSGGNAITGEAILEPPEQVAETTSVSASKTESAVAGQRSTTQSLQEVSRSTVNIGKVQAEQFKEFSELLSGKKSKTSSAAAFFSGQDQQTAPAMTAGGGSAIGLRPSARVEIEPLVSYQPVQDSTTFPLFSPSQDVAQLPRQDVAQTPLFDTRQESRLDTAQRFDPFDGPGRADEPEEELFPKRRKKKDDEKKRKRGFVAEVRRGGKFVQVGEESDLQTVATKAISFVQDTSARSFRIRTTEGQQVRPSEFGSFLPPDMFRASKGNQNVIVEKSRFAINTGGERQEITNKGISSPRRKKGGIFGR